MRTFSLNCCVVILMQTLFFVFLPSSGEKKAQNSKYAKKSSPSPQQESSKSEHYLLCRKCGHEVVESSDLLTIASTLALRQRNDTIMASPTCLIQLFQNPAGEQFEVITAKKSDIVKVGDAHPEDSWFPGYSWTIAVCPKCGAHLGWHFDFRHVDLLHSQYTKPKTFSGLVLDYLLSDTFSDTLTVVPKPKF